MFVEIISATFPVFLLTLVGYVFVRTGILSSASISEFSKYVVYIALPPLMFQATAQQPIEAIVRPGLLLAYAGGSILCFGLMLAAAIAMRRNMAHAAFMALGASAANSGFIGYPVAAALVGPLAVTVLPICMVVEGMLMIPLTLVIAGTGVGGGAFAILQQSFLNLAKAPYFLALLCGIAASWFQLHLPSGLSHAFDMAARSAPPMALICTGGTLAALPRLQFQADAVLVATFKLIVHPLCVALLFMVSAGSDLSLMNTAVIFASMPMISIYAVVGTPFGLQRFCAATLMLTTIAAIVSVNLIAAYVLS